MTQSFLSKSALTALLCFLLTPANGHSWVEQLTQIAPNGTFVGEPGYPRGNVLRTDPGFSDTAMVNLIPPNGRADINQVLPTDKMCRESQQSLTQSDGSPRLQAGPGDAVALRFQENGHVTLPEAQPGKPENRGHIYVYGTTDPKPDDTLLSIHKKWNADGTGGDGRGVLLSIQNYDDGRCYQVNGGEISTQRQAEFSHEADPLMGGDIWCQQDIALPDDAPSGKPYTLYWVWDWPTEAGVDPGLPDGKEEIYTTCMDIDIVADVAIQKAAAGEAEYVDDQPLNNAAIPSQMAQLREPAAIPSGVETAQNGGDATATESATTPAATPAATLDDAGQVTVTATVTVTASSPPETVTEKFTITQKMDRPPSATQTEASKLPIIGASESQSPSNPSNPTPKPGAPGAIPEEPTPVSNKPTATPQSPIPTPENPVQAPEGPSTTKVDTVPTPEGSATPADGPATTPGGSGPLVIIPITAVPADPSTTPSPRVSFTQAANGRFRITTGYSG